jgi:hypothetical protein
MQRLMTSALKLHFRTKLEAAKTQTDLTESLSCEKSKFIPLFKN